MRAQNNCSVQNAKYRSLSFHCEEWLLKTLTSKKVLNSIVGRKSRRMLCASPVDTHPTHRNSKIWIFGTKYVSSDKISYNLGHQLCHGASDNVKRHMVQVESLSSVHHLLSIAKITICLMEIWTKVDCSHDTRGYRNSVSETPRIADILAKNADGSSSSPLQYHQ